MINGNQQLISGQFSFNFILGPEQHFSYGGSYEHSMIKNTEVIQTSNNAIAKDFVLVKLQTKKKDYMM